MSVAAEMPPECEMCFVPERVATCALMLTFMERKDGDKVFYGWTKRGCPDCLADLLEGSGGGCAGALAQFHSWSPPANVVA